MAVSKDLDTATVGVHVGDARRKIHLALSELSVDLQQHGEVRDATKDMLKDAQSAFNDVVKEASSAKLPEPVNQNQPEYGQASVPDVTSQ